MTRYRPFRSVWSAVVRLSRACLLFACGAFFAAAAASWQLVSVPTMFVCTMAAAGWCLIVGGE